MPFLTVASIGEAQPRLCFSFFQLYFLKCWPERKFLGLILFHRITILLIMARGFYTYLYNIQKVNFCSIELNFAKFGIWFLCQMQFVQITNFIFLPVLQLFQHCSKYITKIDMFTFRRYLYLRGLRRFCISRGCKIALFDRTFSLIWLLAKFWPQAADQIERIDLQILNYSCIYRNAFIFIWV